MSFEQVHQAHHEAVYQFILGRVQGDREDAEDLTVETFVTAHRAWQAGELAGEDATLLWLQSIAVRLCESWRGGGDA